MASILALDILGMISKQSPRYSPSMKLESNLGQKRRLHSFLKKKLFHKPLKVNMLRLKLIFFGCFAGICFTRLTCGVKSKRWLGL